MKIQGWSIEAFGCFRDFTVRNLGPNLNVLLGPNEAGKSTLLEFIRGVLFGFPLKRGKPVNYPAPAGLRHGGWLFVTTGIGPATIERFAEKGEPVTITYADGRTGSDVDLHLLLRQADDGLFRNVFAISLSELQDFATLSAGGVREKIFSAGVAGAGRSARAVIDELSENAGALFKPRAGSGVINQLLIQLEDLRLKLANARDESEHYLAALEEEERLDAAMRELAAGIDRDRQRKTWYRDLVDLWPVWSRRSAAERRRALLPVVETFPAQAAVRLAETRNRIAAARERLENLDSDIAAREQQRDAVLPELQPALVSLSAEASDLAQGVALHRRNLRELAQTARAAEEAQIGLDRKLLELGAGWDEGSLAQFDVSIPRREEIRHFADAIEKAGARHDDAVRVLGQRARELEQREREAERLRQKRDSIQPPDSAGLLAAEQAIRRLRAGSASLAALQVKSDGLAGNLRERRAALAERRQETVGFVPAWLSYLLFGAAALALAAGAWQFWLGAPVLGAALVAAGLIGLLFAITLNSAANRAAEVRRVRAENSERLEAEIADIERAALGQRQEIDALKLSLRHDAETAGVPALLLPDTVENRAAELEARKAQHAEWKRLDEALNEAAHRSDESDAERMAAQAAAAEAARALEIAAAAWTEKKRSLGVSDALSPEALFQFFTELDRARDLLRHRDLKRHERQEFEAQILAWEERVHRQLRIADRPLDPALSGEPLLTEFATLQRACAEQLDLERRLAALEAELVALGRQRDSARATLERCEWDLRDLFREAAVAGEAEFHARLAVYEERKTLGQDILSLDNAIRTRLGERADFQLFVSTLAQGDVQGWTEKLAGIDAEMERSAAARDQAVREQDAARQRRIGIERSADIPSFESQLDAVRLQLDDAVRRWRVETLAAQLLQETLAEFQRTRQPAVITEAARAFARITGGRYQRILPQDDGETLLVQLTGGEIRRLDELSRGTAEQLYLCLRLAFAREFARRGGALPLVMDDVLVNFDPQRARSVATLLAEFSAESQVLLFTCHPETANLFADVAPGHVRVDLPGRDPGTDQSVPSAARGQTGLSRSLPPG